MASPGYFSVQMKCFEIAGTFLNPRTHIFESLIFGIKLVCLIFTIFCHSIFFYFNMHDVPEMGKGFGMVVTLTNQFLYVLILMSRRDQLLKITKDIEALTTRNSEMHDTTLKRFVIYEKINVWFVLAGCLLLIAGYGVPLLTTFFVAASGYGFNYQFPPQLAVPYEITSLPVYLASYAAFVYGTYSVVIFSVSPQTIFLKKPTKTLLSRYPLT